MISVFGLADEKTNNSKEFWSPVFRKPRIQITTRTVLNSSFYIESPNSPPKKKTLCLVSNALYKLDSEKNPKFVCFVQWKVLEVLGNSGFRLGNQKSHQDFYIQKPKKLKDWVEALSKVCILRDIKADFQILGLLGEGSFSNVYLAKGIKDSKNYAIKSIPKSQLKAQGALERIFSEVRVMKLLNHSSFIKLHCTYESRKNIELVLEYASEGDCFERVLNQGAFSEEDAAKIMRQVLKGLEAIHLKGWIHRDIKLENILLISGDAKIADLGLACRKTLKGGKCGSAGFIAPEILEGKNYSAKVDIFSAGIVLYTLLSGRAAFFGHTVGEILEKNLDCKVELSGECWRNISSLAKGMVKQMTAKNPIKRLTAFQALRHPWLRLNCTALERSSTLSSPKRPNFKPTQKGLTCFSPRYTKPDSIFPS